VEGSPSALFGREAMLPAICADGADAAIEERATFVGWPGDAFTPYLGEVVRLLTVHSRVPEDRTGRIALEQASAGTTTPEDFAEMFGER